VPWLFGNLIPATGRHTAFVGNRLPNLLEQLL
jgi:hypothetical protein